MVGRRNVGRRKGEVTCSSRRTVVPVSGRTLLSGPDALSNVMAEVPLYVLGSITSRCGTDEAAHENGTKTPDISMFLVHAL
jgi:hypothetical protein